MKRALILSTLILSLITACFTSPDVSAAAAGPACPVGYDTNATAIQLGKTYNVPYKEPTTTFGPHYSGVYSFTVTQQGYLTITPTLGDTSGGMYICPGAGDNVGQISIAATKSPSNIGLAPGKYGLVTFGLKSFTTSFTASADWEIESNDSFSRAQTIAPNKTYHGESSSEYDYFKFSLPAAGKVTLNLSTNIAKVNENSSSYSSQKVGLYSYTPGAAEERTEYYQETSRAAWEAYRKCTDETKEYNECLATYQASLLEWNEYWEGADETLYTDTSFPSGSSTKTSPELSLPAGDYYIKLILPYTTDYAASTYTLRVNYASDSGVVEKASSLNTNSNITLTSLKGTTLSGATISRPEMVQQLMNQGYKKADAIAAVDSLGIDFSYNAVRQALAIRAENPKQTFNDITYGLLKTTYNFNNFQRRKARTILARWVATGEIK